MFTLELCNCPPDMDVGNVIKVSSANVQGLRNKLKCIDVMNYFLGDGTNILCLQDTHLLQDDEKYLKKKLNCDIILYGTKTSSRGVAVILNKNFEYKVKNITKDSDGNMLVIDLQLLEISVRIINIYGSNEDNPNFFC